MTKEEISENNQAIADMLGFEKTIFGLYYLPEGLWDLDEEAYYRGSSVSLRFHCDTYWLMAAFYYLIENQDLIFTIRRKEVSVRSIKGSYASEHIGENALFKAIASFAVTFLNDKR